MQWRQMERFQIFSGWKQTFEFAEGLLELHDTPGQFYYNVFKDRLKKNPKNQKQTQFLRYYKTFLRGGWKQDANLEN